jgi:2-polyprenyl-3-methyl-5-hydroxy-6-metoxy-1,4-benzoquinol methylase
LVDRIEILPVSLLDQERQLVINLKYLANLLKLEFGWHYLLDLTWILSQLKDIGGMRIMDAGAGVGILQWYLAQQGVEVLSVDRESRADLPVRFRQRYQVTGLRSEDLMPVEQVRLANIMRTPKSLKKITVTFVDSCKHLMFKWLSKSSLEKQGQVTIYNQDLRELVDIQDSTFDAVVAVSSLEHNSLHDLSKVVDELMRVLKPGGLFLATLCAAKEQDWFHEPSQGWCYTDQSLRHAFRLPQDVSSNYAQFDQLLEQLRNCNELRDNLARFYYHSGDNGMPWGIWDPLYQPVGVCKVKQDG